MNIQFLDGKTREHIEKLEAENKELRELLRWIYDEITEMYMSEFCSKQHRNTKGLCDCLEKEYPQMKRIKEILDANK